MWIENTAPSSGTRRLYDSEIMPDGYAIEFGDSSTANVQEEVAVAAIEKYPSIEELHPDRSGANDDDESDSE